MLGEVLDALVLALVDPVAVSENAPASLHDPVRVMPFATSSSKGQPQEPRHPGCPGAHGQARSEVASVVARIAAAPPRASGCATARAGSADHRVPRRRRKDGLAPIGMRTCSARGQAASSLAERDDEGHRGAEPQPCSWHTARRLVDESRTGAAVRREAVAGEGSDSRRAVVPPARAVRLTLGRCDAAVLPCRSPLLTTPP